MRRASLLLIGTLALSACNGTIAGPDPVKVILPGELLLELTLSTDQVEQHGSFTATVSATNISGDTLRVVTPGGCLHTLHVYRGNVRIPFDGTAWGCTAAITTHVFAPGESRTHEWTLRARLYAEHPGDVEGAPAPKGSYSVLARFDTAWETGGPAPVVSRTLTVR
jgi:hypothetical protein